METKALITPEELEEAYRLRFRVYCLEKGYLDADDYLNGQESDEYDAASVHIGCFKDGEMVGYARVITPSDKPFPIEKHFQLEDKVPGAPFERCEVSRLIISNGHRGSQLRVLKALVRQIVFEAECRRLFYAYAVVEKPLLDTLRRLGLPFVQIGAITWYMNTENYPSIVCASAIRHSRIDLSDNWQNRVAEGRPQDELVLVV